VKLISIQIGSPQDYDDEHSSGAHAGPWRSAIVKTSINGPVEISSKGVAGDSHADTKNHGGPEKAVLVCSLDNGPFWADELGIESLPYGAFGENFCVAGATENDVAIGDIYEIGTAVVQVSQPRQPCWKQGRRWATPRLPALMQETGRTGWYLRVLKQGIVEAGQVFTLRERPFPQWTVAEANRIMFRDRGDLEAAAALAQCEALSPNWKKTLSKRLSLRS